jgi:hypothetical protein
MRDGLAAGDRVQLHINNGKKKAYIRNGLDWIKRFPVGRSAAFCQGRVKSAFWHFRTSRDVRLESGMQTKADVRQPP